MPFTVDDRQISFFISFCCGVLNLCFADYSYRVKQRVSALGWLLIKVRKGCMLFNSRNTLIRIRKSSVNALAVEKSMHPANTIKSDASRGRQLTAMAAIRARAHARLSGY